MQSIDGFSTSENLIASLVKNNQVAKDLHLKRW